MGVGGEVIIEGSFKDDNGISGTVGDFLKTASSYDNGAGRGVIVDADGVMLSNITVTSFYTGVELADNIENVTLNDVTIDGVVNGIRKGTTADVDGLTINGGEITDGAIGIYFAKTTASGVEDDGLITNVTINGTNFSHLLEKGIYAEALDHTLITGITMEDVGEFGRAPVFGGTGSNTSGFGNGIDINLKNGTYTDIVIESLTFTDVGSSDGDGTAHAFGGAISLKARDDGSYATSPAEYVGNIIVRNGTIDGTSTGIRAGEPGKSIDGLSVTIQNVEITGAEHPSIHGDIDNVSQSTVTVTGSAGADSYVANPTATGSFDFDDLDGDDTFTGSGDDDALDGAGGTDTANFADILAAGDITIGAGGWSVATTTEGTDTLFDIEIVDGAEAGQFLLVGNGGFDTIQEAVDAASAGDTILIAEGTYVEQVIITTSDISLFGVGDVVIESPSSGLVQITTNPQNGKVLFSIVTVEGADNVNIQSVTIDGEWQAGQVTGGGDFNGIAYVNALGSIDQVEVVEIGDAPIDEATGQVSGNQRGNAILVTNEAGSAKTISITNSTFSEFQKTAIVARNTVVTAQGNTITTVTDGDCPERHSALARIHG
ncbi:hypothetical protein [Breoghania sp.]|uniref:beta strand repeat-containing protein n=1 Tax=Breoghania sp. TaxID=2065378 RepID=UPI002623CA76|nr:hypothetical protein [Breoghania sp.]MDJ0929812.1 hypothetical protein [Breoghania sp.]